MGIGGRCYLVVDGPLMPGGGLGAGEGDPVHGVGGDGVVHHLHAVGGRGRGDEPGRGQQEQEPCSGRRHIAD